MTPTDLQDQAAQAALEAMLDAADIPGAQGAVAVVFGNVKGYVAISGEDGVTDVDMLRRSIVVLRATLAEREKAGEDMIPSGSHLTTHYGDV